MADTTTTILGLVKPEVGASTDSWGPKLNTNFDDIDALFDTGEYLKLAKGGTGAGTAAGARTNLGLGALAVLGSVAAAQIATDAVETAKIKDANVTAAKLASGVTFPSGTRMLFHQTAAPTGWTKDATQNDKALRVVSGTVGSGGTVDFSTAFASKTVSGTTGSTTAGGTVGNTTLTESQIPAHTHLLIASVDVSDGTPSLSSSQQVVLRNDNGGSATYELNGTATAATVGKSSSTGGGSSHTHTFTGTGHTHSFSGTVDLAVKYVDIIIAQKD